MVMVHIQDIQRKEQNLKIIKLTVVSTSFTISILYHVCPDNSMKTDDMGFTLSHYIDMKKPIHEADEATLSTNFSS